MVGLQIENPIPVGRMGNLWLIASADDIDAGNTNGDAQIWNGDRPEGKRFSDVKSLQVWYKFGYYYDVERGTPLPFNVEDGATE